METWLRSRIVTFFLRRAGAPRALLHLGVLALSGCSAPPAVGSVGVVLGRDGETHDIFVRENPNAREDETRVLLPGDQLVMVEGVFVRDLSTKDLRALLRGAPGSEVSVTVLRGQEVLRLKVKRTALKSKLVPPGKEERVSEQ